MVESFLVSAQVKHYRALQEQASTYLDLVCSVCDLADDAVRVTAADVQRVKLTVRGPDLSMTFQ